MKGFAVYHTPVGPMRVDYEDGVVVGLRSEAHGGDEGTRTALTDLVAGQLQEYFSGTRKSFGFPYELRGTDFQRQVWSALLDIPYGQTRSYRQIAQAIGRPTASRAVGAANGKNPIWIAIPCHRVVGTDGSLTGYAGGVGMKRALLELEKIYGNS